MESELLRDVHGVLCGPELDEAKEANRQSEDVQQSMQRKLHLMCFQALAPCICSLQRPFFIFLLWALFLTLIWFDGMVWALVAYSLCRLSGPRLDTNVWLACPATKLGILAHERHVSCSVSGPSGFGCCSPHLWRRHCRRPPALHAPGCMPRSRYEAL